LGDGNFRAGSEEANADEPPIENPNGQAPIDEMMGESAAARHSPLARVLA